MTHGICGAQALRGVPLEHACYEVLKLLAEIILSFVYFLGVRSPEMVASVIDEKLIEWILFGGFLKRIVTSPHEEQYDPKGEQVHNMALVGLLCKNLGGHEV